jgi:hypothetical protein
LWWMNLSLEGTATAIVIAPVRVADVSTTNKNVVDLFRVENNLVLDDVLAASVHMVDHGDALFAILDDVTVHGLVSVTCRTDLGRWSTTIATPAVASATTAVVSAIVTAA